VKKIIRWKCAI